MPNPHYNNMHGANRKGAGGGKMSAEGTKPESFSKQGTANWGGLPGKTQGKDRSGGAPTTGKRGPFYVKKLGL